MNPKDFNRSKAKMSHKQKQYHSKGGKRVNPPTQGNTSSSSAPVEGGRAVIDLQDSSDEQRRPHRGWMTATVPEQQRRDMPEDDEEDLENGQIHAGDFTLMSQLPTSVGGYFKFTSENNWEMNADDQLLDSMQASEYFTLNLKLLNVGLQTIPFHKRMDYSSAMFTREQIVAMDKSAELAEQTYQNVLREHEQNPRIKINSGSQRSAKSQATGGTVKAPTAPVSADANKSDELDELLSMTTMAKVVMAITTTDDQKSAVNGATDVVESTAAAGNKEDIQQWLDNVLEE